jgi:hypothetical protein
LIVPVQILLITFAMRGFSQGWNIEVEQRETEITADGYRETPLYSA